MQFGFTLQKYCIWPKPKVKVHPGRKWKYLLIHWHTSKSFSHLWIASDNLQGWILVDNLFLNKKLILFQTQSELSLVCSNAGLTKAGEGQDSACKLILQFTCLCVEGHVCTQVSSKSQYSYGGCSQYSQWELKSYSAHLEAGTYNWSVNCHPDTADCIDHISMDCRWSVNSSIYLS